MLAVVLAIGGTAFGDLNDGLIAYYPFNGNANDETGNGHDGIVYGATLGTDRFGNLTSAYSFDGVNDYISITDTAAFGFKNQSFTVSLWAQVRDNDAGYESFVHLSNQNDTSRFPIAKGRAWWTGSRIYTEFDSGWVCQVISSKYGDALPLNTWMHLVSVVDYEAGKLLLYADSQFQGKDDIVNFDFSSPASPKLFLGMGPESDGNYLSGLLDDVHIYNRALNAAEVAELYIIAGPTVVPVPAALILGMLGLGTAGWRLRRRRTL